MKSVLLGIVLGLSLSNSHAIGQTQKYVREKQETNEKANDWKQVSESQRGEIYYDTRNIIRSSEGKIKVWVKMVTTSKADRDDYIRTRKQRGTYTKRYDNYSFNVNLQEYDCEERKFRFLLRVDYDDEGRQLDNIDLEAISKWSYIVPETPIYIIFKEICSDPNK